MRINILGRPTKKVSKKQLEQAGRWFCKKLFDSSTLRRLKLQVKLNINDPYLFGESYYDNPKTCNYRYDISLNRHLGDKRMVATLAHELVHVKQYVYGEYVKFTRADKEHLIKWCGKYIDHQTTPYWEYPWEIEACGLEVCLYHQYCEEVEH